MQVVSKMDNILFKIGLTLTPNRDKCHRRWIDKPLIVSISAIIFSSLSVISLMTSNYELAIKLGDIGLMMKLKLQVNVAKIFSGLMILMFQWINYYNYKRGVELKFISLFQAICGVISPNSLGINRVEEFNKIKYLAKKCFVILKYQNNYVITSAAMTTVVGLYVIAGETSMIIPYGLVHSLLWMSFARTFFSIVTYQIFYFCFVCKYLKVKVAQLNLSVKQIKPNIQSRRNMKNILYSYDALIREISQYNATYWSKFLAIFWIGFGTFVVITLIIFLGEDSHIVIKLLCSYQLTIYLSVFLLVILSAAAVHKAVKISYPILHQLILISNRASQIDNSRGRFKKNKIKVIVYNKFNNIDCFFF